MLKGRDIPLLTKVCIAKVMAFSSNHVQMWELDHKEGWALKNWWFWTMVSEITLESPSDCKEIKPVNPKGNQPWIFVDRLMLKLKSPLLWPPDTKSLLIERDPDAGKDWRQEEKGTTEDKMVGRHHWLDGHEFEQALGAGDAQGSLACYSPWGRKELGTTEQLNWLTNIYIMLTFLWSIYVVLTIL